MPDIVASLAIILTAICFAPEILRCVPLLRRQTVAPVTAAISLFYPVKLLTFCEETLLWLTDFSRRPALDPARAEERSYRACASCR